MSGSRKNEKRWAGETWDDENRRAQNERHDPHDIRAVRLANSAILSKGVADYRESRRDTIPAVGQSEKPARVFARARPLTAAEAQRGEWDSVTANATFGELTVHAGSERLVAGKGMTMCLEHQTYPGLSPLVTDNDVYESVRYLVQAAATGGRATLFMYGMTSSGKTHTMAGVHARAPVDLLSASADCGVHLAAFELVGKKCLDLLADEKREVFLRIGDDGNTHVHGVTKIVQKTATDLQQALQTAAASRETAATAANATSSRSHAVYHVTLPASGGSLCLIDLAGNEASAQTFDHDKEQMSEAAEINASLMAVNSCLRARAAGASHVPYRDSTLTRVLRDALVDPKSHLAMVACVSPCSSHLERTTATLKNAVKLLGDVMLPASSREELTSPVAADKAVAVAKPSSAAKLSKKAEMMRQQGVRMLLEDLHALWAGADGAASDGPTGWEALLAECRKPALASIVDDAQLAALHEQVGKQVDAIDLSASAFESFCVLLSEHAHMPCSRLIKLFRYSSDLPGCAACLQACAPSGVEMQPVKWSDIYNMSYNGKCRSCFVLY